jgi:UV DNA damage endonuclease
VIRFGYASQNLTIPATTGRTLRLVNLPDAERVRSIVGQNLSDLETIIRWNAAHGVGLFRMSQQLVPFASHLAFPYDWEGEHGPDLQRIGAIARDSQVRLSLHPGQFIQPGSPTPGVAERSLAELRYVVRLLSRLGSDDSVLVLHLGGAYGDKETAATNFVRSLCGEDEILRYLALENDERIWTVEDVVGVASRLHVRAILDTLHHELNPGSLTLPNAIDMIYPTWSGRPKLHLSSQDPAKQRGAHAFKVTEEDLGVLTTALDGREVDIMIEAKGKEQAVPRPEGSSSSHQPSSQI